MDDHYQPESAYAWWRLMASLALMTVGGAGMYAVSVVLPAVQADFGVDRADASMPYTLTMIGFGIGGILMGLISAHLWQRFYRTKLPPYLAFFGGRRFVPMLIRPRIDQQQAPTALRPGAIPVVRG